jgi:hypothetical protein
MSNTTTTAYNRQSIPFRFKEKQTSTFEEDILRLASDLIRQQALIVRHLQLPFYSDTAAYSKTLSEEPLKKHKNIRLVNKYAELKEGWDKDGAPGFSPDVIERAISLLQIIRIQPEVFPTLRGSIQFEYEVGGKYLEFEIFDDRTDFYLEGTEGEQSGQIQNPNEVNRLITQLHA